MATVNLSSIITPANIVTASGTETLTNKTIAFGSNSLTDVASLATSQTLTNKTINIASNTLTGVQSTLVSGTSIKTINSTNLLGSGDIALSSALTLLSTVTASNSSTVDIETTFSSTYDNYLIVGSGIFGSTNEAIKVRLKIGGSYLTAGYDAVNMYKANSDAALLYNDSNNAASASLVVVNTNANSRSGITMTIFEANSSARKTVSFDNSYTETTGNSRFVGSIGNRTAGVLSGVRIFGTGTLSGTFRLYGIANS